MFQIYENINFLLPLNVHTVVKRLYIKMWYIKFVFLENDSKTRSQQKNSILSPDHQVKFVCTCSHPNLCSFNDTNLLEKKNKATKRKNNSERLRGKSR